MTARYEMFSYLTVFANKPGEWAPRLHECSFGVILCCGSDIR